LHCFTSTTLLAEGLPTRMGRVATTVFFTAVLTAVLVSAFWIWFYNFVSNEPVIETAGNFVTVNPSQSSTVANPEGVEVRPAGLAIPVVGVKPSQLLDTYDQARAAGRRHDAIDIMAAE